MPLAAPIPLVLNKAEWKRIVKWTDKEEDPETTRRREYVKYLNETSSQMTKNWPNSLENVNKRNEELRRARIEAAEQTNTKFYKRYLKRQQEEQDRLMYNARDLFFKAKDAPKLMLSAVLETATQKERQEQLKFLAERRRDEAEQKRLEDDNIIRRAKEWHELHALKRKRRFETNKAHQKEILDQAHEVSEKRRNEYETELNMQKMDNRNADAQMDALKKFDADFKAAEKERIWSDMERSRKEMMARKQEQAARDQLDDKLLEILLRSKARVEQRRKKTEKDLKDEKLRVLENISKKLESGDAAREANEQAILDKAIRQKEAVEEARRQADLKKKETFRQERIEARAQYLRDEAQRLHEFNTMRQWEVMNRFKNEELYNDFQDKLCEERERKIKEYRADILRLWRERAEREARERAETRHYYGPLAEKKLRDDDNRVFAHAAALAQEARDNGRPDYALQKALDRYCKLYRLYPMPELPASMQEHFSKYAPRDGSKPDPWYKEPAKPPPDRGPDEQDDQPVEHEVGKGDGLETEQPKPDSSKAKSSHQQKVESVEDYKRTGPANGLQRNMHNLYLPHISVVPCQTPGCVCAFSDK